MSNGSKSRCSKFQSSRMLSRGLQKRQRGGSNRAACRHFVIVVTELFMGNHVKRGLMAIPRMSHQQKCHCVIWQIVSNLNRKVESSENRESSFTDRLTSQHYRLAAILASTFLKRAGTTIVDCDLVVLFRVVAPALGSWRPGKTRGNELQNAAVHRG